MPLPGKPTVVAVKDDKYAIVAVATKDAASEGKMVVVNLATKEIMKEVGLTESLIVSHLMTMLHALVWLFSCAFTIANVS